MCHLQSRNRTVPAPAENEYIRERISPRAGDPIYLHLSDLRRGVEIVASDESLVILDYGADLAPYRSLFPNSDYRRADIPDGATVEYKISADGTVPERSQVFDLILSTQVLEHVEDPSVYLCECFRLLKPGGTLALSTHGSFEDHGFPHDYQRWTASGLQRDLAEVGFRDITVYKMTTGLRAVVFLLQRSFDSSFLSRKTVAGLFIWLARPLLRLFRPVLHWLCDLWLADHRLVLVDSSDHRIYIGLLARAVRPSEDK